ncbi:uncharacterized protein LOC132277322 isoform X2 [Cornus florida]|uniref:uncharacterized protein LOC132277322 isoform X2 n=1 Tax=Cornus florida TaxID=4283 RepID=UPI00289A8E2B|nr:uncharacterized protein LOC132277322 isoform X2 [Cornus florida]
MGTHSMDSATKKLSNPNPRNPKNVHHIGGIPVEFPYQPYGSQLAFMGRVISTLDRAQRDGHCHALLESPTGTGKSLSLLCSALAWQQNHKRSNNLSHSKPAPEAFTDPLAYGGGFVPETESLASGTQEPAPSKSNGKNQKKKMIPTILYASRTHSQIAQVIREYKKTAYRVPMAVLASRKHYCTNTHLRGGDNIDEQCKLLLKNPEVGCSEFKNVHKVKGHPSLQKGGCHEAHDIEDLVKVGQVVKGCSYFAALSMEDDAQLVFCPYSYIMNPVIRRAMDVDINGAIVILDEAHNIEDMARDAGSMDLEEDVLLQLQTELGQLSLFDAMIYQPLYEMTQDIMSWIGRRKNTLEKRGFQHYFSCWTGDKALKELQEANISQQCFPILQECATKAIKVASDAELDVAHLSGMSVTTLEGLFSSLNYFFSGNGLHIFDYQLVLQRCVKSGAGNAAGGWTHTLSLWCLNPAIVFRGVADLSLSVILTSGTLSPMNSFSSELGVQFGTCLEAPHVIDVESQLWAAIISTAPGNYPLNASYKTADGFSFQDALGTSLEEICKIVPGGCLVFFPSYKLMEKLCSRWHETGQWSRLNARKSLFVEPRGGNQDEFEAVLKGYYDSIRQGNKLANGRKRGVKKMDLNKLNATQCTEISKKEGAAFLAVCRGKVSEGIDFSDENARVVIIVGIPFPNIHDIQVAQKKKYNDMYKSSKNLLSGNEWYCHQAFRALNQAADERFCEERNTTYISKWLRKSIRQYDNFEKSLEGLSSFFRGVKERLAKGTAGVLQNSDIYMKNIPMDQSKVFARKKSQRVNKSNQCGREVISTCVMETEKTQHDDEVQALMLTNEKDIKSCREYIDVEFGTEEDSRCTREIPLDLSPDDPEISVVKETPGIDGSIAVFSPGSFSRGGNSGSTIVEASAEFPDKLLLSSFSLPNSSTSKSAHSMVVTPERNATARTNNLTPEAESFLNLSVNSHARKRRMPLESPLIDLVQEEQDVPDAETSGHASFMASSMTNRDANHRIEFGCETNFVENISKKPTVPQSLISNYYGSSCVPSGHVMDKRLQIFCSFCRNPLGLPENHYYVTCSLTSSSKVHLTSLLTGSLEPLAMNNSTSISVVISDTRSVDHRLCNRNPVGVPGQGIWCQEDGCVFSTIFCPFCSSPSNCLGVRVMATDASNVQFLNKVLFYFDRLEIKNLEASKGRDLLPFSVSEVGESAVLSSIEKFSYSPKKHDLGGWRTTKSKMRLPKRGLNST